MKIRKVLTEEVLGEDTLADASAKHAEAQAEKEIRQAPGGNKIAQEFDRIGGVEYAKWDGAYGNVEEALDRALRNANRVRAKNAKDGGNRVSGDNVLLIGRAGTGKTERIKNWCKQRGIKPVAKDAQFLDPTDLAGIIARDDETPTKARRLGNTEFDELDDPNTPCVLFLDEINRAPTPVLGALLTLVQNHLVVDPDVPGGKRVLRGMLFTVAAMNPESVEYDVTPLDQAMRTRMKYYMIEADNEFQKKFYENYYKKEMEAAKDDPEEMKILKGQFNIANTLMNSPSFAWDTDEDEHRAQENGWPSLNPRTLTQCLFDCDGTKEDFLDLFPHTCNPDKLEMVIDILDDYEDVDDEANAVFKNMENPFAQKRQSMNDLIQKSGRIDFKAD